jgi:glucose dehydrogenase
VDAPLSPQPQLGPDAHDGGRAGVQRRHRRSDIHAFDAVSGNILWEFTTNSGIIAPPTTFTVDGKQYLAVHAGWEGDARAMTNAVRRFFPGEVPNVPQGGAICVFALNE